MGEKKQPLQNDFGTPELQQHVDFVVDETIKAGVKRLRNVTQDPVAMYYRRKLIDQKQYLAAETFAYKFRKSNLTPMYSTIRFDEEIRSSKYNEALSESMVRAKKDIDMALNYVGYPLAKIVIHVCGMGNTAGSWQGVKKNEDGMTALRLALDGLKKYYKL